MEKYGETATWLRVSTSRVIATFIDALARSHGWQTIYLVSPWISNFGPTAGMTYSQLLKRLKDDDATAYVVSRPPVESWHKDALDELVLTQRANVALVPTLHTKLYCAITDQGAFAMMGSANLTEQSLSNREIGVLIRESGSGTPIFRKLVTEAATLYRSPGRQLLCKRNLSLGG